MAIIKEFREFIARGNVIDLAVGVIIGASFSNIVKSLTDDVIMPIVGKILGGVGGPQFQGLLHSAGRPICCLQDA